jgi:phosphohistidine phosphatase
MCGAAGNQNRKEGIERAFAMRMRSVLTLLEKLDRGFSEETVHELRVALRRCRAVAAGGYDLHPDPQWKGLRKAARALFRSLGRIRDAHVTRGWVTQLAGPGDPVRSALEKILAKQERSQIKRIRQSLSRFDKKQWKRWIEVLPSLLGRMSRDEEVLLQMARMRLEIVRKLHRRAVRTPNRKEVHELRVAVKRFRYTLENFLPAQYQEWAKFLGSIQDLLGEIHDLDVIGVRLTDLDGGISDSEREKWSRMLAAERERRFSTYRGAMTGRQAPWKTWQEGLS